jgi:hypothetical protein
VHEIDKTYRDLALNFEAIVKISVLLAKLIIIPQIPQLKETEHEEDIP